MGYAELYEQMSKPEKLSFPDQFRLSVLLIMDLRNREHEYFQYKAGVLDEESWLSYRQVIVSILASERGRQWWTTTGKATFAPGFVDTVDSLLGDADTRDYLSELGQWE